MPDAPKDEGGSVPAPEGSGKASVTVTAPAPAAATATPPGAAPATARAVFPGPKAPAAQAAAGDGGGPAPSPPATVTATATVTAPGPNWWSIAILIIFSGTILILIAKGAPILDKISDPAFARGLITFIISLATIGLAFTMVYQAFYSQDSSDDRFRRAREIFTGLMGVLGTIVGFYFGSTGGRPAIPQLAEVQVAGRELMTHASGGTPPYKFTLTATGKFGDGTEIKVSREIVSDDGWLRYEFPKDVATLSADVLVKDNQNVTASKKTAYEKPKADEKPKAVPALPQSTAPAASQ